MNENQLQEMRELAIKQYSITEENEPNDADIKKAKDEVGAMKPGGDVKMKKAKTDPPRDYVKDAMKTAKGKADERIAASHAKPDPTPKTSKPPGMSNDERKEETKKITARRVQGGADSKPVTDTEIGDSKKRKRPLAKATKTTPKSVMAHTEYKRIGIALAESMGLREDKGPQLEGTAMSSYLRKLLEQAGLPTTPVSRGPNDRYTKMRASDVAKTPSGRGQRGGIDSQVKSDVAKENKTVSRRVGAKTDVNASQLIQQRRNRASAEKEAARKKTLKTGKQQDTTPSIIPPETRADARADAAHSRKKVSDAGEQ